MMKNNLNPTLEPKIFLDHDLTDLKQLLKETHKSLRSNSTQLKLLAFWDFDGTILKGDISEGFFPPKEAGYAGLMNEILQRGWITDYPTPEHKNQFWKEYQAILVQDKMKAYCFLAQKVEELPPFQREQFTQLSLSYVKDALQRYFFRSTLDIIQFLHSLSVEQFIISASPSLFVQAAKDFLSIPASHIFGIHELSRWPHLPHYGEGKAQKVRQVLTQYQQIGIKSLPLFAAGNNWTSDGPMCLEVIKQGGMSLIINLEESVQLPTSNYSRLYQAKFMATT